MKKNYKIPSLKTILNERVDVVVNGIQLSAIFLRAYNNTTMYFTDEKDTYRWIVFKKHIGSISFSNTNIDTRVAK